VPCRRLEGLALAGAHRESLVVLHAGHRGRDVRAGPRGPRRRRRTSGDSNRSRRPCDWPRPSARRPRDHRTDPCRRRPRPSDGGPQHQTRQASCHSMRAFVGRAMTDPPTRSASRGRPCGAKRR
jgi:hypothetical protein